MDQDYSKALEDTLSIETELYGEPVTVNGVGLNALVSLSATSKNLRSAGFFKNQVLDIILPKYSEYPELGHKVIYKENLYTIREVETLEYDSGTRAVIELVV
jgi:hypothetical protein